MSSNNKYTSDLNKLHNIIQSSMLVYPKEIIISTLRDYFSKDRYFHYSKDKWGFANTTDHTDLPLGADIPTSFQQEGLPTRLFIGENYRYDGIFYPAILVKSGGSRYVPISINREQGSIQNKIITYEDGYGNQTLITRPEYFITAGAWEGSIVIDILTRSLRSRDSIAELVAMALVDIHFNSLVDIGIVVKPPVISSPGESDDRSDKLFKISVTIDIRTEWRREIPVGNLIDVIHFTTDFADISNPNSATAQNLRINT